MSKLDYSWAFNDNTLKTAMCFVYNEDELIGSFTLTKQNPAHSKELKGSREVWFGMAESVSSPIIAYSLDSIVEKLRYINKNQDHG